MAAHDTSLEPPGPRIRHRSRATTTNPDEASPDANNAFGEYSVGYGRPPAERRFQKGRSGNPRGRPKKSESIAAIAREELDKKHKVNFGDASKNLSVRRIGVLHEAKKAAAGDPKAFSRLLEMAGETNVALTPSVEDGRRFEFSSGDAEALVEHFASILLDEGMPEDRVHSALTRFGFGRPAAEAKQDEGNDV